MTLVVTYTEGFLGCFTVNPDGTMRQRALIDTGSDAPGPQELAETGMVLANQYGWQLEAPKLKEKALPAPSEVAKLRDAERKRRERQALKMSNHTGHTNRNHRYPPMAEREGMIVKALTEHPRSTIKEVLALMGQPTDEAANGNWNHTFTALRVRGTISREGSGNSAHPFKWFIS